MPGDSDNDQDRSSIDAGFSPGRRQFLKISALAGAAATISSSVAYGAGESGFWAKDLEDEQLVDMYRRILRIRWHERTMADKMMTDPTYRGYNHFYAGQEAVAVGVCSALRNAGSFDQIDLIYSTHRPTGHAIAKGVDLSACAPRTTSAPPASIAAMPPRCISPTRALALWGRTA